MTPTRYFDKFILYAEGDQDLHGIGIKSRSGVGDRPHIEPGSDIEREVGRLPDGKMEVRQAAAVEALGIDMATIRSAESDHPELRNRVFAEPGQGQKGAATDTGGIRAGKGPGLIFSGKNPDPSDLNKAEPCRNDSAGFRTKETRVKKSL